MIQTDTQRGIESATRLMLWGLTDGTESVEEIIEKISGWGVHIELTEEYFPESRDLEGMEFAHYLDEMDGILVEWVSDTLKRKREALAARKAREKGAPRKRRRS